MASSQSSFSLWAVELSLLPAGVLVAWIGSEVGSVRLGAGVGQFKRLAVWISAAVSVIAGVSYFALHLNHGKLGWSS